MAGQHGGRATLNLDVDAATRVREIGHSHPCDPVRIGEERQIRGQGTRSDCGQLVGRLNDLSILVEPDKRLLRAERTIVLGGKRDDSGTMTCPVCRRPFTPTGRQTYCDTSCRKTAFRRRHQQPLAAITVPAC